MSCPKGKQWYVCSKRSFRGCCSADPCTDGICPDGDATTTIDESTTMTTDSLSSTTESSPTTTDSTPTTTSPTTSVSTETFLTTESNSVITITATHSSIATTTAAPSSDPESSSNGALIGGIVGGVLALLALLALLLCLFCCRRRKQGKHFTLVRSSSRDRHNDEKADPKKYPPDELPRFKNDRSLPSNDNRISDTSTTTTTTYNSPGMTLSSLQSSPDSGTRLLPETHKHKPSPSSFLPPIPSAELLASVPPRAAATPELSDTGFYRQRAELATNSQSELINVPADQRRQGPFNVPVRVERSRSPAPGRVRAPVPGHHRTTSSTSSAGDEVSPPRERPVLKPNFDHAAVVPRGEGGAAGEERKHVMSFMQYDSGSDSPLRGSLGRDEDLEVGLGLKGVRAESGAGAGARAGEKGN